MSFLNYHSSPPNSTKVIKLQLDSFEKLYFFALFNMFKVCRKGEIVAA